MSEINGIKVPFVPIVKETGYTAKSNAAAAANFDEIFEKELESLKFSNHAIKRLEARNIQITPADIEKIQNAVVKAEDKGAQDSLVLMNDKAFIVNIPNRTVVTALRLDEENDKIFTNIDSVVIA